MSAWGSGRWVGPSGASTGTATFLWEQVCVIDFAQEDDQELDGGNLIVTNQITGEPVVLAGQTVEIVSGALVLSAGTSTNIGVGSPTKRDGAFAVADIDEFWPEFDGEPLRWGAEADPAPTFDGASRAWGVLAENAAGIGSGNLGYGYSAEIRATGAGAATRQTRFQYGSTTNVSTVSSTAYAAGLVCGLSLEGTGSGGLWSLNAGDANELDVASIVGAVGSPGNNFGGSPVQGVSRLGVFAVSQLAATFATSITRLVLWARVARVA